MTNTPLAPAEETPIVGRLHGLSAPIGTLVGTDQEGRPYAIARYADGAALIAFATAEVRATAKNRCVKDGEFQSAIEIQLFAVGRRMHLMAERAKARTK